MMRRLSIRIMTLAGIIFLLHIIVPHHHHADFYSLIEHKQAIECAQGLHDHEAQSQEHHHHENLLNEPDLSVDDTSYETIKAIFKAHKLLKMLHYGSLFALVDDYPEYNYECETKTEWNYVDTFYDGSIPISYGLRGPPAA